MTVNNYITRVALAEDIHNPFVWLSELPCDSREIVKLTNKSTSKSIWCEVVMASDNFIERYNRNPRTNEIKKDTPFIVVNAWYREKLGLSKNESANIQIEVSKMPLFIKQLMASYIHPDNTVRLAVDLAFVSLVLGAIGLLLGIISLCK
ncbi:MAG: hypothetical protein JAY63_00020 [Candidatus Thiodiazotropha taylori]|nr:hypothetical protein [Candidatus Thiodiazotropha taylori]